MRLIDYLYYINPFLTLNPSCANILLLCESYMLYN